MSYILVSDTPCRVLAKTKTQKQALFVGAGLFPYLALHTFNLNKGKKALSQYDKDELSDMSESLCGQRPPASLPYKDVLTTVYYQLLYMEEQRPVVPKAFSGGEAANSTPEPADAPPATDEPPSPAPEEPPTEEQPTEEPPAPADVDAPSAEDNPRMVTNPDSKYFGWVLNDEDVIPEFTLEAMYAAGWTDETLAAKNTLIPPAPSPAVAASTTPPPPPPAPAPEAVDVPNRPKDGTVASNCWSIYDSLVSAGTPPTESGEDFMDYAVSVGVNATTAKTQYKKWFDAIGSKVGAA